MKTFIAKVEDIQRKWFIVDATNQVVGRLATEIANVLTGKSKPTYSKHLDTGDFVVVVNAEKVALTGDKWNQKKYYRHSGFPNGLKTMTAKEMLVRHPEDIIKLAVKGMLPHNSLNNHVLTKLKVYAGTDHPHTAQKPEPLKLN